jgi:8-oxo-dGTP pyrophosphatase MutT (NUDIX family)
MPWPAIRAARAHDAGARIPFLVNGLVVGSVARRHRADLRAWPGLLQVGPEQVAMQGDDRALGDALAQVNEGLRQLGLIVAWRDESFAIVDPASRRRIAAMERAAARFWGTLTFGAHANGFVADAQGRPTHLWIAQRAFDKATDPGMFDNLIGGGVPDGQSALQTLVREGWEEAGLDAGTLGVARAGGVLCVRRDIPEGLQHEWIFSHDLELSPGHTPRNQDGEVARFELMPVDEALRLAAGTRMTVDASLVTLDFALRHALLPANELQRLAESSKELWVQAGVQ